jgi:hypothetical protein
MHSPGRMMPMRLMTLGIRLFAVAVAAAVAAGALLTFAVKASPAEIDTGTVGVV